MRPEEGQFESGTKNKEEIAGPSGLEVISLQKGDSSLILDNAREAKNVSAT